MLTVIVAALTVTAVGVVRKVQRDHEWAHGGDRMTVDVEVRLADPGTFDSTIAALGTPPGKSLGLAKAQAVVAQVTWTGWAASDGWFQLVALDKRESPSRVLAGEGGWTPIGMSWNPTGLLGSSWVGSYDTVLAEHYDWLAGLQPARSPTGSYTAARTRTPSVNVPSTESGTATVWFTLPENAPQIADPSNIIIGLVYVQGAGLGRTTLEAHVRWARRIFG
jgi:hypothetical protein